ncbi:MAG: beta-glucosidase [Actinomycetia bacterium]|nr:beta-glucosidase [Actinomycetes bacterium]
MELTLDEKIALLSGSGAWHTAAVPRIGLGRVKVTDGPNGARGDAVSGARAACFPVSVCLGASWDTDLVHRVGSAIGLEAALKQSQVLLAPTVNIQRHPLAGRNFECYSEDPALTSAMAVAFISGVQTEGVGACVKHFVANDLEFERMTLSSDVADEPLREVYLRPFEAAVTRADVWTVMGAYNGVNGTPVCADRFLLTEVLRDEWGFDGLVMSDWYACKDPAVEVKAGLDLEMPGPPRTRGRGLRAAIDDGRLTEADLDPLVDRVVELARRAGRLGTLDEEPEQGPDLAEHRGLAREAAAAGAVLLRNHNRFLPLGPSVGKVAVIGPNAERGQIQGGGSSGVRSHHRIGPLEGFTTRTGLEVIQATGCVNDRYVAEPDPSWFSVEADGGSSIVRQLFRGRNLEGPAVVRSQPPAISATFFNQMLDERLDIGDFSARWTARFRVPHTGTWCFGLASAGTCRLRLDGRELIDNDTNWQAGDLFFAAGSLEQRAEVALDADSVHELVLDYRGPANEPMAGVRFGLEPVVDDEALLVEAERVAASADVAVVVVGLTSDWESEGFDRPSLDLPGRQVELIGRVVAANPNTVVAVNAGSPVDLSWVDQVPAVLQVWYPGQEFGHALADMVFGDAEPGGRLPHTVPASLGRTPVADHPPHLGHLQYAEGLLVGHRWYDRHDEEPRFPFGFGLGWADPELGEPTLARQGTTTQGPAVEVPVVNRGPRAGSVVVQVYVEPPDVSAARPLRQLGGFTKIWVEPGATRTALIEMDPRALQRWDRASGLWLALEGPIDLRVGLHSRDLRGRLRLAS